MALVVAELPNTLAVAESVNTSKRNGVCFADNRVYCQVGTFLRNVILVILTSERAELRSDPILSPALPAHVVDGGEVGVVYSSRNVDVAGHAGPNGALAEAGCCGVQEAETVRGGAGGGGPLYRAVLLLLSDTRLVVLRGQELTGAEPVTLDISLHTSEPLDTVGGGAKPIK